MEANTIPKADATPKATFTPAGYPSVTPYLIVRDAARAIDSYEEAFGATERLRLRTPEGKVAHAEIEVSGSPVMLADEMPEWGTRSPETLGGSPVAISLYVDDVDARFRRALAAGASERRPVQDQFYGDRSGTLIDPFGHEWMLATHQEDVAPEEMQRRFAAAFEKQST